LVSNVSKHLGVIDSVTSPTFAIVNTYEIPSSKFDLRNLIHVDTYRLENLNEVYDLGLETLFDDKSVTFIEWGERIQEHIGKNYFVVTIDECNPESRDFRFKIEGTLKQVRLSEINDELLCNGWESQE